MKGEGTRLERMMDNIDAATKGLNDARDEFRAAEDFFSEAMSAGKDEVEAAQLLKEAREGFIKAADHFNEVREEVELIADKLMAAEGVVESVAGALNVALTTGDAVGAAASAEQMVEATKGWRDTIEALPGLKQDEQGELDAHMDGLGITNADVRTRMENRFKVLLAGTKDRDVTSAIEQLQSEDQFPKRIRTSWSGSEAERRG